MAFFFPKTQSFLSAASISLEDALRTDPGSITDPATEATRRAQQLKRQVAGEFSWGRLAVAVLLLLGLFFATIYTSQEPGLEDFYKILLHSFELVLGLVIGLLSGEAISR